MSFINIEIKARTSNSRFIRQYLQENGAVFKGTDNQSDTYYNVPEGRLKLRQGNIESNLIYYRRNDQPGPKQSDFNLLSVNDNVSLNAILAKALGIKVVVVKKRDIYYISNVKFHLDELEGIGSFVEIEAGNKKAPYLTVEQLREQCDFYKSALNIKDEDLVYNSYSDMLLSMENG